MRGNRIPHLDLIPILLIAFVMHRLVNNFKIISDVVGYLLSLLSYFVWGFAIAYFVNPLMTYLEKRFKIRRIWSMLIIYILLIGILTFFAMIIIPRTAKSLWDLAENIPRFISQTQIWLGQLYVMLEEYNYYDILPYVKDSLQGMLKDTVNNINIPSIGVLLTTAIDFTSGILKLTFGTIISIYLLKDKEKFIENNKRLIYAMFNHNKAASIIRFGRKANSIFSNFIVGKAVDSAIIGIMCFIGLMLLRSPFALLLSLIVGVTNMIPYFGPFIGMIPAVVITLFYSPIQAFWVFVFILLLQQFDGWILGPKILGDHVGLSPFWVIMAIVIGGGISGVMGMFLGVPVMAVIKVLLNEYIDRKTKEKKMMLEGTIDPK